MSDKLDKVLLRTICEDGTPAIGIDHVNRKGGVVVKVRGKNFLLRFGRELEKKEIGRVRPCCHSQVLPGADAWFWMTEIELVPETAQGLRDCLDAMLTEFPQPPKVVITAKKQRKGAQPT